MSITGNTGPKLHHENVENDALLFSSIGLVKKSDRSGFARHSMKPQTRFDDMWPLSDKFKRFIHFSYQNMSHVLTAYLSATINAHYHAVPVNKNPIHVS